MNTISQVKYPIAFEWPIPERLLRELKDTPGEFMESDIFKACESPDIDYYASIYSYEPGHKRHGKICIFLFLDLPDKIKTEANFNIKIESAKFHAEEHYVYHNDNVGWGRRLCTTDQLFDPEGRFIVNGELRIKIDGFLMVEKEEDIKEWKCGKNDDSLGIGLWEQDESKDFTVEVDGKEITVHKSVLAARSHVFARMFQSGMKEAQEDKVEIEDFSSELVEKALKLLYHHSLVTYISIDDKLKLLQFFDKYDVKPHKENLENYLITVVNELTVCRLVNASLISNAVKLEMKCYTFLQDCLNKKKPVSDYDLLDKDFALNLLKNAFCHVSE